jgi:hypothetical protein
MKNIKKEIDELIQTCTLDTPGIARLLLIIVKLNQRIDDLEADNQRTADLASCLANGIQPD